MIKLSKSIPVITMLLVLAGCAGKDFVRPTQDVFRLGSTTYSQVVQQLGEPRREGTLTKNDKTVKSITYVYASTGGEPVEQGVIPARAMSYFFSDDILVGQEFVSSFKSDSSNFDDTKIARIEKGKTKKSELIQILGRPSGSYIPPMIKATSGEAIGYIYSTTSGGAFSGFKIFRKALLLSFNENEEVVDIEFSTSGSK